MGVDFVKFRDRFKLINYSGDWTPIMKISALLIQVEEKCWRNTLGDVYIRIIYLGII